VLEIAVLSLRAAFRVAVAVVAAMIDFHMPSLLCRSSPSLREAENTDRKADGACARPALCLHVTSIELSILFVYVGCLSLPAEKERTCVEAASPNTPPHIYAPTPPSGGGLCASGCDDEERHFRIESDEL